MKEEILQSGIIPIRSLINKNSLKYVILSSLIIKGNIITVNANQRNIKFRNCKYFKRNFMIKVQ